MVCVGGRVPLKRPGMSRLGGQTSRLPVGSYTAVLDTDPVVAATADPVVSATVAAVVTEDTPVAGATVLALLIAQSG